MITRPRYADLTGHRFREERLWKCVRAERLRNAQFHIGVQNYRGTTGRAGSHYTFTPQECFDSEEKTALAQRVLLHNFVTSRWP